MTRKMNFYECPLHKCTLLRQPRPRFSNLVIVEKNYYENEILKILEKNHNSMSNMGVFINETSPNSIITRNSFVNFLAGGILGNLGLEIDFVRNPISESAA